MPIVTFDPQKMNEPRFAFFNKAGDWGPGCDNEADCTIEGYEFPAVEDPPFDVLADGSMTTNTRGKDYRGPYVRFDITAKRDGEKTINERWFIEQNEALVALVNLGVSVEDDGTHDSDHVVGIKCIVRCGDPGKKNGEDTYSKIYGVRSTG